MVDSFAQKLGSLVERMPAEFREQARTEVDDLLRRGIDSPRALIDLVADPRTGDGAKAAACWVLGRLGDKRAARSLLAAFREGPSTLITTASVSLGLLQAKSVVPPLIDVLAHDALAERRFAAARALGEIEDSRAVGPLLRRVADTGEDPRVRGVAAEALGYLGARRAVTPLIAALRDPSPEVRFNAAFALGWLRDPRALPELERVAAEDLGTLHGSGDVGREALNAIASIRGALRDQ